MPETDIGSTDYGDMTNTVTDFSVDAVTTDGPGEQKETEWINPNWPQQLGYYKAIPEMQATVDAKAVWTVGKGFKAPELTELKLLTIKGFGVDSFNSILSNMIRTYQIGGDAFAEIIRDKRGELMNLKPLDPGVMKIIANRQGLIIRYEQVAKKKGKDKKFKPEDIFHLSRNRLADEIHGNALTDPVEDIILMRNEAMADQKQLMHRNVVPRVIWKVDTDDATEIAAFKAKADAAVEYGENIFVPKGVVEHEILSVAPNATLNPLPWIQMLSKYFYQATGVPEIIVGGSQEITEASSKILYLAFQQMIEGEQLYIEEQVLSQLNLEINLEFPASLENELLSDQKKDGPVNMDPSDTTVSPEEAA
jgi:hypothetical protein|tara:strand:+ start:3289 stop:4380 length:1092 start_codon:yes stop_codon:yes gene_type:complete